MNPITNKTVAQTIATSLERDQGAAEVQKTEPSKFDKVRADQLEKSVPVPSELPPPVTDVPPAQRQKLQDQLRHRVEASHSQPGNVLKVDMQNTKVSLDQLGRRIATLPKAQSLDPLRNRFAGLEQQYNNSAQMLSKIGSSKNPQDFLQLQMQMYMMTENIQLVSKVVDQVTGGVKTLLQTQI